MKKFKLISEFKGYVNKVDITNTDPRYLVAPSQNVIINDGERVGIRPGYELFGGTNATLAPIESSYDWVTSTNVERNLRAYDDKLQVYYASSWIDLMDGFSSVNFNFAEWWSISEVKDLLIFVNGTSNIYMWSGGITTLASSTATTLTKEGTTTWAEDRFLLSGTREVVIGGTTYAYTGGEGTTTLTGVTPDPTAGGHAVGSVVIQKIRTTANSSATSLPSVFNNDLIRVLDNYVYIGDLNRRDIYVSKNTNYLDFSFTTPVRVPGEGAIITLDSSPVGFVVEDSSMYITGSKDDWYQTKFTLSSDLTKESLNVIKLKSGPGQGAYAQESIGNIKNSVVYFSNEKTVDTIGRVENIDTPQSLPLSDAIKSELLSYDVTIPPHIKYFKSKTYITFPSESKTLIYDHIRKFWLPPWSLPVRRFAIIDGELYGHSNAVPETYRLLTGITDNGNPINAIASFAYRNYGIRDWPKNLNEWFTEGYISPGTNLDLALKYDFGGSKGIVQKTITGDNDSLLYFTTVDNSLGKNPLGSQPLGSITDNPADLAKFRAIAEFGKVDFYEIQVLYATNQEGAEWELLAFGGNIMSSTTIDKSIKI